MDKNTDDLYTNRNLTTIIITTVARIHSYKCPIIFETRTCHCHNHLTEWNWKKRRESKEQKNIQRKRKKRKPGVSAEKLFIIYDFMCCEMLKYTEEGKKVKFFACIKLFSENCLISDYILHIFVWCGWVRVYATLA